MPGKKDHITVDIYYSLEDQKGIHTEEVDLLNFKEWNDLPSWYPIFQIPYQIDAKVTCTGFYIYVEIIYIDSSRDPEIFAPYVYNVITKGPGLPWYIHEAWARIFVYPFRHRLVDTVDPTG